MQLDKDGNTRTLSDLIVQQITESPYSRIPFAEFMELVLYHPQLGYYATSPTKIGAVGDFFTSPHLGADFGELIAEQLIEMWHRLQQPQPFTLVEMGAGQGLLAADILNYLHRHDPRFFNSLEYRIIERATAMIAQQQYQLRSLQEYGAHIQWCSLANISPNSITGCFFSNELVDALPVHQVVVESQQLKEIYVTIAASDLDRLPPATSLPQQFTEIIGDLSTPRLADYFELVGVDLCSSRYPKEYRSEVNLAALDWIASVATCLNKGYVLTIDYGYPSDRYYHPVRSQGTLQCYYRHAHHSNPYRYIGQQDITAHVDFTALQKHGEHYGLQSVGLTKQGLFLMGLGLGDRLSALGQSNASDPKLIQETLRRREALQMLVNPIGLGNFGVLIQSKNVEVGRPLRGLLGELNVA